MARFRVGPVRFGGGRRPSATVGVGPLGVTVGGGYRRRARSGGTLTRYSSGGVSYYTEPDPNWVHVAGVFESLRQDVRSKLPGSSDEMFENHDNLALTATSGDGKVRWIGYGLSAGLALTCACAVASAASENLGTMFTLLLLALGFSYLLLTPTIVLQHHNYQPSGFTEWWDENREPGEYDRIFPRLAEARPFIRFFRSFASVPLVVIMILLATKIVPLQRAIFTFVTVQSVVAGLVALRTWLRCGNRNLVVEELKVFFSTMLMLSAPASSLLRYEQLLLDVTYLSELNRASDKVAKKDPIYRALRDAISIDVGRNVTGSVAECLSLLQEQLEATTTKIRSRKKGSELLTLSSKSYPSAQK